MLVSKLCDFWPQAVSSRFSNNQNHYFIDFWLGSWRLRGRKNVSVGHETSIPSIEKVSAVSFSSRGLFFSSIWTVRPRYARSDNCPISEKKSPLLEKKVRPWGFLPLVYLFPALQNIYFFLQRKKRIELSPVCFIHVVFFFLHKNAARLAYLKSTFL